MSGPAGTRVLGHRSVPALEHDYDQDNAVDVTGPAIDVSGLNKRFGSVHALRGLSFAVPHGGIAALLGPNGAGKTTTIRILCGLAASQGGTIRILGHDLRTERQAIVPQVGAVLETPRFYPFLTASQNLHALALTAGAAASPARLSALLEQAGLDPASRVRVAGYSAGMRRRLALAAALLTRPRLLILDEPTNGLDPAGVEEFRVLIRAFVDDGGTVLFSSHQLDEIQRLCAYVVIIAGGVNVLEGPLSALAESDAGGLERAYFRATGPRRPDAPGGAASCGD